MVPTFQEKKKILKMIKHYISALSIPVKSPKKKSPLKSPKKEVEKVKPVEMKKQVRGQYITSILLI